MVKKNIAAMVLGACALVASAAPPQDDAGQRNPLAELAWQVGPLSFPLGTRATIELPTKLAALSESESDKFLKLTRNLQASGLNIVTNGTWWATFEFDDAGHVKDDEKIDADALLQRIKDSDGPANEARRKAGYPELITDGWFVPPHYDASTQRLEWGLRIHAVTESRPVINYTVRMLGRTGYERVVLVTAQETLDRDVEQFKQVLKGFDFKAGEKYSEFRQGDRVAPYGLAALVAGGAAAVAAKSGFWKVLLGLLAAGWKLVAAGVVAVAASLAKFFKRKT